MKTLHDVYTKIAYDIGDVSFSKVTRGEYISLANNVAEHLSRYIDLFVRELDLTVSANTHLVQIPALISEFYNEKRTAVSMGDFYEPVAIEKIMRNNVDCKEVSWSAVRSAQSGNRPFQVNDEELDSRHYATTVLATGLITLQFAVEVQTTEKIQAFVTCRLPMQKAFLANATTHESAPKWSPFKDYMPIPQLLSSVFYKKLRLEILDALFMREGDAWGSRLMNARVETAKEVHELRRYLTNVKDKSTVSTIKPYKFLEDNDSHITNQTIAHFPEDWTTISVL